MKHTLQTQLPPIAVRKATFANAINTSTRTVERWIDANIIPSIKLPSSPDSKGRLHGTVLIPLHDAIAALNLFRTGSIGEATIPAKRRMTRVTDQQPITSNITV